MIKYCISFIALFIGFYGFSQERNIYELNSTGLPDYRKILNIKRASNIVFSDDHYFIEITPEEIQKCHRENIQLTFDAHEYNDFILGKLNYRHSDSIFILNNILHICKIGGANYQFDLFYTTDPTNLKFSSEYNKSESVGFIAFQNRFARYATIASKNRGERFNVAIVDRDLNGFIDSNDIITVSYDNYFLVKPTKFGTFLKDSLLIDFEGDFFYVFWLGGYKISVSSVPKDYSGDLNCIQLNKLLHNFIIDEHGTELKDVLSANKTIISFWAGYCSPCVQAIPRLNEINQNVIGFQADLETKKYENVAFLNYFISSEVLGFLGINGFPNYMVVDRDLNILYFGRDVNEAINIIQE
jgi:thiol-disulfide isomerase/thioredoxin